MSLPKVSTNKLKYQQTERRDLMQSILSKRIGGVFLFFVVIITLAITLYFTTNFSQEQTNVNISDITPTPTVVSTPTQTSSPISPISPAPPKSTPASSEESRLGIMFETGLQAYERGDYVKAKEEFEAMIDLNPNSARAFDGRGTVYTALGELDKAVDDYSKAIELNPLFPPPYYNRGRAFGQLKRYDEALIDLGRSVDLAPFFFGYRANGNIGLIHYQLGEYEKALEAFAKSISYTDEKADIYYFRGETYIALENYETAIADYEAAIERFSLYDLAYQGLGYAYYKTGQFEKALDNLNQAVEIAPASPIAHLYLALVYLATDQPDKAISAASQGVNSINALSEEEQESIFTRVLTDLETVAQEQPDKSETVETIINLIPTQ